MRVFERLGLGDDTYVTLASGGAFTDNFSHEFQTISEAGEDVIYLNKEKGLAINEEDYTDAALKEIGVGRDELTKHKAAEVGNIFSFGGSKSEELGLYFTDEDGNKKPVILGSYGIGITRLMGVLVEYFSDNRGIVWPEVVAPFQVYLAVVGDDAPVIAAADELYERLTAEHVSVLYDDRIERPGKKFADADLIGLPWRIVVSSKTIESGEHEICARSTDGKPEFMTKDALISKLANR